MEFPDYITFGSASGAWSGVSQYLRVTSLGAVFIAKFGELKGQRVVVVNFEQVHKKNGTIQPYASIAFNGIRSYIPIQAVDDDDDEDAVSLSPNDIVFVNGTSISKAFGVDLHGTAAINHKCLTKSSADQVPEAKSGAGLRLSDPFKKILIENMKAYKYNAIRRYMEDPDLRKRYHRELSDIDNVYKGPGKEFKWKDLVDEFG